MHINWLVHPSPKDIRSRIFFGKMSNKRWFTIAGEENRRIKKYLEWDDLCLKA